MASGQRLHYFLPHVAEYPIQPVDTHAFRRVRTNTSHLVIEFAVGKGIHFKGTLARNYAGGGITVKVQWAMVSATSGNVNWDVEFQRIAETLDLDSNTFGATVNSGDVAVPGTAGVTKITDIECSDGTEINNLEVGEFFRVLIKRTSASLSEASGNAQVVNVELVET